MTIKSSISTVAASVLLSLSLLATGTGAYAQTPATFTAIPAGDAFITSLATPFNITSNGQTTAGTLYSAVFSTSAGTRDFFYQFVVGATSSAPVTTLSLSDFAGYNAVYFQSTTVDIDDAGVFTAGGDTATNSFTSSGTAFFSYAGVAVGGKSDTLLIRTTATNYGVGNGAVISGASANAAILAPAAAAVVPEANTVNLLGLALPMIGAVTVVRRRKG
ncbi:MAG: hypothetical protein EOP06_05085 [Proteobacteria bacterium]|nr:MAG: hypothetical protein EOP06_05085 [Pseudomonadota bacterium]